MGGRQDGCLIKRARNVQRETCMIFSKFTDMRTNIMTNSCNLMHFNAQFAHHRDQSEIQKFDAFHRRRLKLLQPIYDL
jgi:hypothetical protein